MTEREQFEAWTKERRFELDADPLDPWTVWQARAALSQQAEPVSDSEMVAIDSVIYGGCVTLDGKRIDPTSVYAAPPADDEAVRLLREARQWAGTSTLQNEIDAYLAKVGK